MNLRLAVQIEPHFGYTYREVHRLAREAEDAGFEAFWISDHFFLDRNTPLVPAIDCWTLLAALARDTTQIRLGTLVTSQSFRPPALLAKIAASVDHLSGGRLEFGIGAGARELDYQAYGYTFPPPGERVGQLKDALEIVRRMWTQERATYHGKFYSVEEAPCAPKPVQRPHPPIWIGGAKPRMLRIAARYADAISPLNFWSSPEQYAGVLGAFADASRSVGRDPSSILKSHCAYGVVADGRASLESLEAELQLLGWRGSTAEAWPQRRSGSFIGTPDAVLDRLAAFEAAGAQYVILQFPYGHERQMIGLAGREILPALSGHSGGRERASVSGSTGN